jgi:hypothetical protein
MSSKSRYGKGKRVPRHNYLPKVEYLYKHGAIRPGQVSQLDIAHDGWCPKLSGGTCSCNPDVRIRWQMNAGANN